MNISIITVTYNAASTLERTLKSVERQDCRDYEHVIVDGASSDDTMNIIDDYKSANPDKRIVVLSEPDKGLYDAMNKALRMAKGKFVCFLNAGDKLHSSDTLTTVNKCIALGILNDNLPGVIYGETDIVDNDGKFLSHRRLKTPKKLTWKSFRNGMLVCHQSFYANREIAVDYDLSYRFSADFDWCVRVMKSAEEKNMPLVDSFEILTDYLSEGMTTQNHKASLKERFNIMSKHYGRFTTLCCHAWFLVRSMFK